MLRSFLSTLIVCALFFNQSECSKPVQCKLVPGPGLVVVCRFMSLGQFSTTASITIDLKRWSLQLFRQRYMIACYSWQFQLNVFFCISNFERHYFAHWDLPNLVINWPKACLLENLNTLISFLSTILPLEFGKYFSSLFVLSESPSTEKIPFSKDRTQGITTLKGTRSGCFGPLG